MASGSLADKTLSWNGKPFSKLNFQAVIVSIFVALFVFPVLIVTLSPIHIFRYILSKISKYIRSDLGKMLSTRSTVFASEKFPEPNPHSVIVVSCTFEGCVSVDLLRRVVLDRVLTLKLRDKDEIRYPELKQYPTDWMGFKFWKNDEKFDIENHVKLYETKEVVTDSVLHGIRQNLLIKPFSIDRSPWEFLVVPNYVDAETNGVCDMDTVSPSAPETTKTVVYFRIHHAVADGFSILKFLMEGISAIPFPKPPSNAFKSKKPSFMDVIDTILFPIRACYEFSESFLSSLKSSPFHVPVSKRTHSVHAVTRRISMHGIKQSKLAKNVSFSSLIFSACAGALQAILERKGMQVPEDVLSVVPLPLPGHPENLRNYMSQCFISLPLAAESDPTDKINMLNKSYVGIGKSTAPAFNSFLICVMGGLFVPMIRVFLQGLVPSVYITNFPANFHSMRFEGHRYLDVFFYSGLINIPAIAFCILSFEDKIRVVVVAEGSLISSEEVQHLAKHIENELNSYNNNNSIKNSNKNNISNATLVRKLIS